jgi:hypothetical protein
MTASATKSLGYYEMKLHKPWFDEEYSELLEQRKQAKLQWFQNWTQTNGDNLNNVRYEISRIFRNKKREYLKEKINEVETYKKKISEAYTEAYTNLRKVTNL